MVHCLWLCSQMKVGFLWQTSLCILPFMLSSSFLQEKGVPKSCGMLWISSLLSIFRAFAMHLILKYSKNRSAK